MDITWDFAFYTEISISVVTLISAWLIGNKSVWGQRIGLAANACWWFYVIFFQRWGLAPMQIVFTIMSIRNLIKWEKEEKKIDLVKKGDEKMDKFSAIVLHGIAKDEENGEESIIVLIVDNDINKLKDFLVTLFVGGKLDSEQHLNLDYADLEFSFPPPFFGFVTTFNYKFVTIFFLGSSFYT